MNHTLNKARLLVDDNLKHICEFGVYTGRSIRQLRSIFDDSFLIYGFDSFRGLPEDWHGTACKKGDMSTQGKIPTIPGVEFYPGWFSVTIPKYLQVAQPIGLLHVDCDLYSSTNDILYGLWDYIVSGTVIVFDEWYFNHRDIPENRTGEQKSFYEWVDYFSVDYELMPQYEDERRAIVIK